MSKPNRFMSLSKTNYFANLKKKAYIKSDKSHEQFNLELLNCIAILDARIANLEKRLAELGTGSADAFNSIRNVLEESVGPAIDVLLTDFLERYPEYKGKKFGAEDFQESDEKS